MQHSLVQADLRDVYLVAAGLGEAPDRLAVRLPAAARLVPVPVMALS